MPNPKAVPDEAGPTKMMCLYEVAPRMKREIGMKGAPIKAPISRSSAIGFLTRQIRLNCFSMKEVATRAKSSTNQDRYEHQTNLAVVVVAKLPENDRVSKEEGVEHGVDKHNVHARQI